MPADPLEGSSPSSVAATPSPPDRPRPFSENRKSSKPIMEKRRRARINESLGQLKTLILDALKKDSSRHSKLEKADILEMTVKHLRGLQRVQMTAAVNADPSSLGKYRAGFGECVGEVTRFLSTCECASAEVRARLLGHLAACASQINAVNFRGGHVAAASSSYPPAAPPPPVNGVPCKSASVAVTVSAADAVKLCGGYRVVAAPDGQFALLIPGAALAPLCAPPNGRPAHASPVAPHAADSVWRPW